MLRRSREGARIEICIFGRQKIACYDVAPVRERGLKYYSAEEPGCELCRSREGARIEMFNLSHNDFLVCVAPVRERGLKLYYD